MRIVSYRFAEDRIDPWARMAEPDAACCTRPQGICGEVEHTDDVPLALTATGDPVEAPFFGTVTWQSEQLNSCKFEELVREAEVLLERQAETRAKAAELRLSGGAPTPGGAPKPDEGGGTVGDGEGEGDVGGGGGTAGGGRPRPPTSPFDAGGGAVDEDPPRSSRPVSSGGGAVEG